MRPAARRVLAAGLVALATTAATLTSLPAGAAGTAGATGAAGATDSALPTPGDGRARLARTADRALARAESALAGRTPGRDVTLALRDLRLSYAYLSVSEQQAADALLDRPYTGGQVLCGTHVCIHYRTGEATDAQARATRTVMESVWTYEVDDLGYRAPASDGTVGGTVGGASRFDVYLADLGDQGIYGYCAPETLLPGQANRATAYCALDEDFAEFPLPGDPSRRVTAAHEFFHAIQFNYDAREDPWVLEATAVWMEDQYADDVNDNRQYLALGQQRKPGIPLDLFDSSRLNYYGNWVLFQRLSQTYGQTAVLGLWRLLDGSTGATNDYSVQGLNRYLKLHGTQLRSFYPDFAAGNLVPGSVYAEGSAYVGGPVARTWALSGRSRTRTVTARLKHLTARSWEATPGRLKGHWRLRVAFDGPKRSSGAGAFVQIVSQSGRVQRRLIDLDKKGNRTVRVRFSRASVSRVSITVTNAGIRYTCATGTAYACQGTPRSDGKHWKVRVQAVRSGS